MGFRGGSRSYERLRLDIAITRARANRRLPLGLRHGRAKPVNAHDQAPSLPPSFTCHPEAGSL